MTVYEDKLNEEMASWIITSTCQVLPKKSFSSVSDQMHNLTASPDPEPKHYSILCGSFAEFYIRPLNRCISDIDFLLSAADVLAFNDDIPVLPRDLSGLNDSFWCYKIESCIMYPGFIRLRVLGIMSYNWKYKNYELNPISQVLQKGHRAYINYKDRTNSVICFRGANSKSASQGIFHGPALVIEPEPDSNDFTCDQVASIWCPQWPKEAKDWPIRPRYNGWPTTDTINKVLQNGCHVVYVQHRSCRDDELQWRLSFSVAEVILIQSLTNIQQIVYHLLRFFAKRELIQKDCPKEDEVLCTYHLKTLMLWTCEEVSPEWWNSSSVFSICSELLQKLLIWLKSRYCPNYFIPEANLFQNEWNPRIFEWTETQLCTFCDSGILCDWFVENYIKLFIRKHVKTNKALSGRNQPNLLDRVLYIFDFRKASELEALDMMLSFKFTISHQTSRPIIKYGVRSGMHQLFNIGGHLKELDAKTDSSMSCLPTVENDMCFTYYDNMLYILHIAYGIEFKEISWDDSTIFVEGIKKGSIQPKVVRSEYHNFPKTYTEQSCRFQFNRAQDLLKNLTGSNSPSEFQLLALMSKEVLKKALEYDDSEFSGVARVAMVYLAALHFATSDYQQVVRFCLAVLVDQAFLKDKEVINAGCLLFIDDVARVVGLCVLHKKITKNNVDYIGMRIYLDLRLSTKVFAHYLATLSAERYSKDLDFLHNFPDSAFPLDEYLKASVKAKCLVSMMSGTHVDTSKQIAYRRTDLLTDNKATIAKSSIVKGNIIDLVVEYALEYMNIFQDVFQKDFGIQCNTVDCYRALYLYKCCQYDEALHLCEQFLQEPDLETDLKKMAIVNVLLLPPLDLFFDRDIQSLIGLHTICYYLSPVNDSLRKYKFLTAESSFADWFVSGVYFSQMQLSTSISYQSICIKCYYFLGRHFLAKYLKVRCLIDCSLPFEEAMTDFASQRFNYPFEHIIVRYLLQKLRALKK